MSAESYSEELLASILEEWPLIDSHDSYQVYALFSLFDCTCHKCGNELLFPVPFDDGDPRRWAKETAEFLRQEGWYIPEVSSGRYDLRPICVRCAKK